MSIETSAIGTLVIVLAMAVVTLVTRWGGIFIMSFVPIGHRVQQFISAMSGSVLVALLAPLAVDGDHGARSALLVTAATMLLLKKPLPAIAAGVAAAASFRQLFPLLGA
ncbi:MAG TPA: AzlD domain-containing protein [Burkholderiaceae bacterium]|nr:AzlD domain-containing protein [Burkholderiaceae bacterium]